MSADEDTELRDLVAQTLESNGVLGKIREQEAVQNKKPFANQALQHYMSTKDGQMVAGLVRDFLEHFNLEYTLAVFEPELGHVTESSERKDIARELEVVESDSSKKEPLLSELIKRHHQHKETPLGRSLSNEDLSPDHVADAKKKFQEYDKDRNGVLEKDELRSLFVDSFPHFHRNLVDRYVNDEFKSADRDFSNGIDFSEFLGMYKRLFVLFKSKVSSDIGELASPRRLSDSLQPNVSKKLSELLTPFAADGALKPNLPEEREKSSTTKPRDQPTSVSGDVTISTAGEDSDETADDDERTLSPSSSDTTEEKSGAKKNTTKAAEMKLGQSNNNNNKNDVFSDDDFFDSPRTPVDKPSQGKKPSQIPRMRSPVSEKAKVDKKELKPSDAKSQSSLAGLPPLGGNLPPVDKKKNSMKAMEKKLSDLGLEAAADDYDEDFDVSETSFPRSARADKGTPRSKSEALEDEIEEEIAEEMSVAEEFLREQDSEKDDLTTDRTVSPTEEAEKFDYIEDIAS